MRPRQQHNIVVQEMTFKSVSFLFRGVAHKLRQIPVTQLGAVEILDCDHKSMPSESIMLISLL